MRLTRCNPSKIWFIILFSVFLESSCSPKKSVPITYTVPCDENQCCKKGRLIKNNKQYFSSILNAELNDPKLYNNSWPDYYAFELFFDSAHELQSINVILYNNKEMAERISNQLMTARFYLEQSDFANTAKCSVMAVPFAISAATKEIYYLNTNEDIRRLELQP